jgi:hypothetical protein
MKSIYHKIITLLFIIVFAQLVNAQNYRRVEADFRKLERYIERIQELVNKFDSRQARNSLILARVELEKARTYLFNPEQPMLKLAQLHILKAKKYTDVAAQMVLSLPFKKLKAQLDDLIDRAERDLSKSRKEEAYYLLHQAKKFQRLAYDAYRSGRVIRGEQYFRIAFFFARKCQDFQRTTRLSIPEQRLELEMSVQQLLRQAGELSRGNENITKMLNEAQRHYEEALQLADEGKEEMAVNRLKLVRRFIYRIYDQADRGNNNKETRIENQLYSLNAFLQSLESENTTSINEQKQSLLDRAWLMHSEAQSAFDAGNFNQAEKKISISQRLANKVFRQTRSNRNNASENLEDRIEETERLLEFQRDKVSTSENEALIKMHEESAKMLDRARQALDNGKNGLAFQMLQMGTRMSARIQRESRKKSINYSQSDLERKYNQILIFLNKIESNSKIMAKHRNIIDQLNLFTKQGKRYWDQGDYLLADEYFDTVLAQIKQYTAKWRKLSE